MAKDKLISENRENLKDKVHVIQIWRQDLPTTKQYQVEFDAPLPTPTPVPEGVPDKQDVIIALLSKIAQREEVEVSEGFVRIPKVEKTVTKEKKVR